MNIISNSIEFIPKLQTNVTSNKRHSIEGKNQQNEWNKNCAFCYTVPICVCIRAHWLTVIPIWWWWWYIIPKNEFTILNRPTERQVKYRHYSTSHRKKEKKRNPPHHHPINIGKKIKREKKMIVNKQDEQKVNERIIIIITDGKEIKFNSIHSSESSTTTHTCIYN